MKFEWDQEAATDVFPELLAKLLSTTLTLTLLGSAIAIVLGLVLALLRRSRSSLVSGSTRWVVEFIRCTPLLVQALFVYYGFLDDYVSAYTAGALVIGIHYATYMSEVYRAGIDAVPKAQWEATTALSLPPRQTWGHVILPQAIPKVLPALGNYVIAMFKDTPQLVAIAVTEMVFEGQKFTADQYGTELEVYTLIGLLFLAVSLPSALLVRLLERHYEHTK